MTVADSLRISAERPMPAALTDAFALSSAPGPGLRLAAPAGASGPDRRRARRGPALGDRRNAAPRRIAARAGAAAGGREGASLRGAGAEAPAPGPLSYACRRHGRVRRAADPAEMRDPSTRRRPACGCCPAARIGSIPAWRWSTPGDALRRRLVETRRALQAPVARGDRGLSRQRRMARQGRRLCDPGPGGRLCRQARRLLHQCRRPAARRNRGACWRARAIIPTGNGSQTCSDDRQRQHAPRWTEDAQGAKAKGGACPICGKTRDQRYDPFCSRRCADVDLHRWFTGGYAIPGESVTPEPGDEDQ